MRGVQQATVRLDGFDGIGRCRHAVMTMNAEDFGRGLSRRTRLGLGTPARVSLHRYVPGGRINLDLFQRSKARREVEIQTVDLPYC